jgi:hypothetical protein
MVPETVMNAVGFGSQSAEVVASSVVMLMAEESFKGEVILSSDGKYWKMEDQLLGIAGQLGGLRDTEMVMDGIEALSRQQNAGAGSLPGSSS